MRERESARERERAKMRKREREREGGKRERDRDSNRGRLSHLLPMISLSCSFSVEVNSGRERDWRDEVGALAADKRVG